MHKAQLGFALIAGARRLLGNSTRNEQENDAAKRTLVPKLDPALVEDIERRTTKLNELIADSLGNQFQIGQSLRRSRFCALPG